MTTDDGQGAAVDGPFLAVTLALFVIVGVIVGVIFVVARIPREVGLLASFDFTVDVLADATYRTEFLDEVLIELRQAFAVRSVHLAAPAGRRG